MRIFYFFSKAIQADFAFTLFIFILINVSVRYFSNTDLFNISGCEFGPEDRHSLLLGTIFI
jgi:hypothetical protein